MFPVVTVVGTSDSGKTTVASFLVESLTERGYRVAAVKHCPHGHDLNRTGSDTDRLYESGAGSVVASSPGKQTRVDEVDGDPSLESVVAGFGTDVDMVIAEGFKRSAAPKVLVVDPENAPPDVDNVIATVSADPKVPGVPNYHLEELQNLAAQIRKQFLDAPQETPAVSLVVDGVPIPMSRFPTGSLTSTVEGFVSSLKGIPDDPQEIRLTIRLRPNEPTTD
ncbi:MAG: molybdopterin-guanine dinucleotide biosynthesis protein B [SAR202 cluster bacterium]|jgi:molybdopterin-guanine dinucleotide biosynthesis protein MobB|nr:molybdopterin-guanine dinucleotide biosynthesis protein B [SAR202 cluster bacterium]